MVFTGPDEFYVSGQSAKFVDDQVVAHEGIVMEDVAFKALRILGGVIVRIIANDDVGVCEGVFDEAYLRESLHGIFV